MPLMIGDVHIESIRESSALDAGGFLAPTVHITFTVRTQGPFSVDLPKAGYTADAAQQAITAAASEQIALLDKFGG